MGNKGFFLLETALLGVILVAAAAVFGTYQISSRMRADSENRMTAAFLAQKQMACIQGNSAAFKDRAGEIPWQDNSPSQPIVENGRSFYVATDLSNSDAADLKQVVVKVYWQDHGTQCREEFSRLIKCDG